MPTLELLAEIEFLKKENERLREALQSILDYCDGCQKYGENCNICINHVDTAQIAMNKVEAK